MNFKRLFIVTYLLSQLIISEAYGVEQKFNLKNEQNKLAFVLEIPKNHFIYWIKTSEIGVPTRIELKKSLNLKDYQLLWPNPKQKFSKFNEEILFYENHLEVPLIVKPFDKNQNIEVTFDIEYVLCSTQCQLIRENISALIQPSFIDENGSSNHLNIIILMAILGGFILNFMPCVLPVLSLKLISFVKHQKVNKKKALLCTIAGIISSFWVIALIAIIFKNTGKHFGFGFNFQEPNFIIALVLILTFFISSSLGRTNLRLSNALSNFLVNINFRKTDTVSGLIYLEHYFSGILATILSTSCTAPFLGSAMFLSFQQSGAVIFLMFTAAALGFSVPYLLMLIWPPILTLLPKSGRWLNKLKLLLIGILACTLFWLLIILNTQLGFRAVAELFLLLLLIKFVLENNRFILKNLMVKFLVLAGLVSFSFLLPEYSHKEDEQQEAKIDNLWQKFEPEKIDSLVNSGKIVFIDITADWCLTCKYNKHFVLNSDRVIRMLSDKQVIAMRGDFTKYDTIINDFLLKRKMRGIPYNVIFMPSSPQGLELPVVLSIKEVEAAFGLSNVKK